MTLPFVALHKAYREHGYSYSCHLCTRLNEERLFLKRSMRGLSINQLVFLHLHCIASGCRLLLRWLPGVELLDDLRADAIQLLLREDAE